MSEEDIQALVIDNGSHTCKAGFAGDKEPTATVQSVVGRPKFISGSLYQVDSYVGEKAIALRETLNIRYPIEHGIITNWDDMEVMWKHIFYTKLKSAPDETGVLVTEPPLNPKGIREKMAAIMFETFGIPFLCIASQPVLALHSTGRSTGIVLESGDSVTHAVPIYEGRALPHATLHTNISGRNLTDYLLQQLSEKGHSFPTLADRDVVRDIKEKLCYVALNTAEEAAKYNYTKQSYKLPDGKEITIGDEQFWCPEALFQPKLIGVEMPGVHETLFNAISKCDLTTRREMFSNIVLSGASTLFPGFVKRLKEEMFKLVSASTNVVIVDSPKRDHAVWVGGSMIASDPNFLQMCISKDDYEEFGPVVAHSKGYPRSADTNNHRT